jgi:hypothetical protein
VDTAHTAQRIDGFGVGFVSNNKRFEHVLAHGFVQVAPIAAPVNIFPGLALWWLAHRLSSSSIKIYQGIQQQGQYASER